MRLIGIFGPSRVGKSTAAREFLEELSDSGCRAVVESFAAPLKDVVKRAMRVPGSKGDEGLKKSGDKFDFARDLEINVLDSFLLKNGLPGLSNRDLAKLLQAGVTTASSAYRWLMQFFGTDVVRQRDPAFWVRLMDSRLVKHLDSDVDIVVIDDGRFINEFELVSRVWRGYTVGIVSGDAFRGAHESDITAQTVAEMCDAVFVSRRETIGKVVDSVKEWMRRCVRDMPEVRGRYQSNG